MRKATNIHNMYLDIALQIEYNIVRFRKKGDFSLLSECHL